MNTSHNSTNRMIKGGILLALAFVLSYFELPVIPAAPWLKLDFSALPILFSALAYGSLFGLLSTGLLQILILFIQGSNTGGVGQIANFIMVGTFILITSGIYNRMKGAKGLITGSVAGTIGLIVAAVLSNAFILVPLFFPGGFPGGSDAYTAYLFRFIPLFNFIKGALISVVGLVAYDRLGFLIRKENISREHAAVNSSVAS